MKAAGRDRMLPVGLHNRIFDRFLPDIDLRAHLAERERDQNA